MTERITVRMASPDDAKALLEIYAPYVLQTGVTFEYEVPSEDNFRKRIETVLEKYPYLVAVEDGKIVGYAYAKELGERAAFSRAAETAVYLESKRRGRGLGRLLYGELERILRLQNVTNLYAAVSYRACEDETITHASPLFHLSMGYQKAAHFSRCGYKFGRWYDIVWYEKHIAEHSENPSEFLPIGFLSKNERNYNAKIQK